MHFYRVAMDSSHSNTNINEYMFISVYMHYFVPGSLKMRTNMHTVHISKIKSIIENYTFSEDLKKGSRRWLPSSEMPYPGYCRLPGSEECLPLLCDCATLLEIWKKVHILKEEEKGKSPNDSSSEDILHWAESKPVKQQPIEALLSRNMSVVSETPVPEKATEALIESRRAIGTKTVKRIVKRKYSHKKKTGKKDFEKNKKKELMQKHKNKRNLPSFISKNIANQNNVNLKVKKTIQRKNYEKE